MWLEKDKTRFDRRFLSLTHFCGLDMQNRYWHIVDGICFTCISTSRKKSMFARGNKVLFIAHCFIIFRHTSLKTWKNLDHKIPLEENKTHNLMICRRYVYTGMKYFCKRQQKRTIKSGIKKWQGIHGLKNNITSNNNMSSRRWQTQNSRVPSALYEKRHQ